MIKLVSQILIIIGFALVFTSAFFAGFILKSQHDNEFENTNVIQTLVNSSDFNEMSLDNKIILITLQEAELNRVRNTEQIWQSIFFLALSTGAVLLSSGLAVFFFWQNRQFNEQLRAITIAMS